MASWGIHLQREHSLQEADDTAYTDFLSDFVFFFFLIVWLFGVIIVYVIEK